MGHSYGDSFLHNAERSVFYLSYSISYLAAIVRNRSRLAGAGQPFRLSL